MSLLPLPKRVEVGVVYDRPKGSPMPLHYWTVYLTRPNGREALCLLGLLVAAPSPRYRRALLAFLISSSYRTPLSLRLAVPVASAALSSANAGTGRHDY